jgi:hypothetical protein
MSADAIKKFLENAKDYPDTTMVTIGDQQVPLSSLRQLNSSERESLATAIKQNADRATELDGQRTKILELAAKAQTAYNAAEEARAKASAVTTPTENWREDPWQKGPAKEIDELKTQLAAAIGKYNNLEQVAFRFANIFNDDRNDRLYEGIDQAKREKKYGKDDLIKYATDNKLLDRLGLPSMRLAFDKLTETERLEERDKTAFDKGREAGRMEALAARMPQPGVPGPGATVPRPKNGGPDADILGDMYQESLKDPELRALIEQLGPALG